MYMPSTKHIRRAGSCDFITLDAQFPGVISEDILVAAFKDVVEALEECAIERQGKPEGTTQDNLAKSFGDKFVETREALFPPDVSEAESSNAPPQPQPAEINLQPLSNIAGAPRQASVFAAAEFAALNCAAVVLLCSALRLSMHCVFVKPASTLFLALTQYFGSNQ